MEGNGNLGPRDLWEPGLEQIDGLLRVGAGDDETIVERAAESGGERDRGDGRDQPDGDHEPGMAGGRLPQPIEW